MPASIALRLRALALPLSLVSLAACAAPSDDDDAQASDQAVRAGASLPSAPLFQPGVDPDGPCVTSTTLAVAKKGSKLVASLSDALTATSTCRKLLPPNDRTFAVKSETDGCRAVVYEGRSEAGAIEITDNRLNMCESVIEARLIVVITAPDGRVEKLVSNDANDR